MTHNPWRSLAAIVTGIVAATNGASLGHIGQPVAIIVSGLVVAVDAIAEALKGRAAIKTDTDPVLTALHDLAGKVANVTAPKAQTDQHVTVLPPTAS